LTAKMAPRQNNESASWELDANKPKPDGETRIRRSFAVKELLTRESAYVTTGWQC
jgi:long-chain acyl-CoA synthetase